jgi:hypothetical protein
MIVKLFLRQVDVFLMRMNYKYIKNLIFTGRFKFLCLRLKKTSSLNLKPVPELDHGTVMELT